MNETHRRQLVIATLCAVAFVVVAVVWWSGSQNHGRSDDLCEALALTDTAEGRDEMEDALFRIHDVATEDEDTEVAEAVEDVWALDAAGEDTTIGFFQLNLAATDC